jgi:Mrp family chromosome partitioning ATPase
MSSLWYWASGAPPPRNPEGSLFKLVNISPTGALPVYIMEQSENSTSQSLQPFFAKQRVAEQYMTMFGLPGIGKSTTIKMMAEKHNSA